MPQESIKTLTTWNIDPAHTNIDFSVRHMMVSTVKGTFSDVSGTLSFDEESPEASSIEVQIGTASVNTNVGDRDNHLRSPDFFDVENYPYMTFKSTKIEVTGENAGKITGDLTIRDVTKEVTLEAEYFGQGKSPFGDIRAGFNGSTKINREDFGLTWNQTLETGGVLVGKEIKINIDLQVATSA